MKNYSNWMTKSNSSEEITFDMAEKSTVKVNGSLTLNEVITNDANEWQKDVDLIWLVKKSHYVPSFGDYIEFSGNHYLSIFSPEERETFWSSKARLCNSLFPIQSDKTQVLLTDENGNYILDDLGEPRISTSYSGNIELPCIAENKTTTSDTEKQLWIPENELQLIIPYHSSVKIGYKFRLYDENFEVVNIDRTKVINEKGILVLRVRKDGGN